MKEFSIEDLRSICHILGYVHVGKTDYERNLGFDMWRAVNGESSFEIRRVLFRYRYGIDNHQQTLKVR